MNSQDVSASPTCSPRDPSTINNALAAFEGSGDDVSTSAVIVRAACATCLNVTVIKDSATKLNVGDFASWSGYDP